MDMSFRLKQKIDAVGGDYYVFQEDLPISIDLSRVVFLIFPAAEENEDGKLVIRPRDKKKPNAPSFKDAMLEEIRKAELVMSGGYVGVGYFCLNWKTDRIPNSPDSRRRLIDQLIAENKVQIYQAADGKDAMRALEAPESGEVSR